MPSFTQHDLKSVLEKLSTASLTKPTEQVQQKQVQTSASTDSTPVAPNPSLALLKQKDELIKELETRLQTIKQVNTPQNDEHISRLEEECSRYKNAVKELAVALSKQKQENAQQIESRLQLTDDAELTSKELQALLEENKRYQTELEEHKKRLLRTFTDKKELESKISALSCEKSTLLARLHELNQKSKQREDIDSRCQELETELSNANLQLETLKSQQEASLKAFKEELSVSQACVIERQSAFETEHKQRVKIQDEATELKRELEDQKTHAQSLEQHLARRIKECSTLKKALDDERVRIQELTTALHDQQQAAKGLEIRVEVLKNNEEHVRQELALKVAVFDEKIESLQQKLALLQHEAQTKGIELERMQKVKARLEQLELLYAQFGQIVTTNKPQENQGFFALTKDIPKIEPHIYTHE